MNGSEGIVALGREARAGSLAKRTLDVAASGVGLVVLLPLLLVVSGLIWLEDRHGPFYLAPRVGYGGRTFQMIKLRPMVVRADRGGVHSPAKNDRRITRVGARIRRFKLDAPSHLWHVLGGAIVLVGPRHEVQRDLA